MTARDAARTDWNLKPAFAMRLHVERCLKVYSKSSTNLLLYSEEFDNAAWRMYGASVSANKLIAPDGSYTADLVTGTGTSIFPQAQQLKTSWVPGLKTLTSSIFVKNIDLDYKILFMRNDTSGDACGVKFVFDSGVPKFKTGLNIVNCVLVGYSITTIGNGWYRLSMTASFNTAFGEFDLLECDQHLSWNTTTTKSAYMWGAQLSEGAALSHYTKTTSASATSSCTANAGVGNECYNTRPTCQDLPNFSPIDFVLPLCARGMRIPPGETWYPYIESVRSLPSRLDPEKGLSNRGNVRITLVDEAIDDGWLDPYIATRAAAASGSFWPRFIARNKALYGKKVEMLRGYDVEPWDWNTFITEMYTIDTLDGPDRHGKMKLMLKDPVKLADDVELPRPTRGTLLADLPQYDDIGTAQGGSANTVILHADASAADGFYNGMAVKIYNQTGTGQERIISAYNGASRTATVTVNWLVNPDASSLYFVQQLSFEVDANGADYDTYGVPGYVRTGKEIIQFTQRIGNVLSWPDTSYRAQFRTQLDDHSANAAVQLCKAFTNQLYTDVIKWFYTQSGLSLANIDEAGFAAIDSFWLGANYTINAVISTPRKASVYIKELLISASGMTWWEPQDQQVKFALAVPPAPGSVIKTLSDDAALIDGSVDVKTLNNVRLTLAAIYYDLAFATANIREGSNFLNGAVFDDEYALLEYGVKKTDVIYSRFYNADNGSAARDFVSRAVATRRDPPLLINCEIHPKDYDFKRGDYRDFLTDKIVDITGKPKLTRALITMVDDTGEMIKVEARTTIFSKRFAFFAPAGTANYPNNLEYACFSQNDGLMPDGTSGYLFY